MRLYICERPGKSLPLNEAHIPVLCPWAEHLLTLTAFSILACYIRNWHHRVRISLA
ncbi:MAG: hypothetical protein ACE5KV_02435 [Thermoplasmata archaeon]